LLLNRNSCRNEVGHYRRELAQLRARDTCSITSSTCRTPGIASRQSCLMLSQSDDCKAKCQINNVSLSTPSQFGGQYHLQTLLKSELRCSSRCLLLRTDQRSCGTNTICHTHGGAQVMALQSSLPHLQPKTAWIGPEEKLLEAITQGESRSYSFEHKTYICKPVYHALSNSAPVIQPNHNCSLGPSLCSQGIVCNSTVDAFCGKWDPSSRQRIDITAHSTQFISSAFNGHSFWSDLVLNERMRMREMW